MHSLMMSYFCILRLLAFMTQLLASNNSGPFRLLRLSCLHILWNQYRRIHILLTGKHIIEIVHCHLVS